MGGLEENGRSDTGGTSWLRENGGGQCGREGVSEDSQEKEPEVIG